MGSHKRKKYESHSSSSESESSTSSDDSTNNRKHLKKSKYSSSNESEAEKHSKAKRGRSSDSSSVEEVSRSRKQKTDERQDDRKSRDKSKYERAVEVDRQKEKSHHKSPTRDRSKDTRRSREKSKEREDEEFRNRKKYDRDRYDDKDRNRKSYSRDRQDDRSRYKRDEYKRDDRKPFRDHRDTRGNDYRSKERDRRDNNRYGNRRRSNSFDHANAKWGKQENTQSEKKEPQPKEKPNFGLSGKLTEETNTYKGIVIKYSEPPEARKPRRRWRLYPFKGEKALQTLYIHRESAYLIGRERKVVDLPVDHPSCSKQHAALQYRLVPFTRDDGSTGKRVRPYLIDLESANGTFINNKKIEARKYYELFEKDVIKFGFSSREYVLLHENSKDEAMDDDVKQEEEMPIKQEPT